MKADHQLMKNMSLAHQARWTYGAVMTTFVSHRDRAWHQISPGVETCHLRSHDNHGLTLLFRMAAGADAPLHHHPGGEETYIVSGKLRIGDHQLTAGDYIWTPPGVSHDAHADEESVFFVVVPSGLRVVTAEDRGSASASTAGPA